MLTKQAPEAKPCEYTLTNPPVGCILIAHMQKPTREKRIGKRFQTQLAVSGSERSRFQGIGETRDISAGGMYFYTESAIMEGSQIELLLPLPPQLSGSREIWVLCKAEVVRTEIAPDGRTGVGATIESYEIVPEV